MDEIGIRESDIQAALTSDKGDDAQLVSWSSEICGSKFDGHTSTIRTIRVKYAMDGQDGNANYAVKFNGPRSATEAPFYHLIFRNECAFYTKVLPALNTVMINIGEKPLCFPKCFHHSLAKGKEVIVFENLRESGCRMEDCALGLTEPHVYLVLKQLARLHAAAFILQARLPHALEEEFPFLKSEWTDEFNLGTDWVGYMNVILGHQRAMFEKMGGCEAVLAWMDKIRPHVGEMYKAQLDKTPPFATIIHGDCWINNMFFRYDQFNNPTEVIFFDLQGCRKASVALDLQHFLNLNVVGEVRREKLTSLLQTYHDVIVSVMGAAGFPAPFNPDQLEREYVNKGFYGLLYGILWLPNMVKRPEDKSDILDSGKDRVEEERRCVLRMVDTNPLLKPKILSVVEEWTERGIIS